MSLSMYQASVPVFVRQLKNLSGILAKAEAYAEERKIEPQVLTGGRLAPDMFALSRQVQIATDAAKGCGARLAGVEVPSFADTESTFEELQGRIAKTVSFLEGLKAAQLEGSAGRTVTFKAGGSERSFRGEDYVLNWAMPNFYFHITTAYGILRHNGVGLGKMDFLGSF